MVGDVGVGVTGLICVVVLGLSITIFGDSWPGSCVGVRSAKAARSVPWLVGVFRPDPESSDLMELELSFRDGEGDAEFVPDVGFWF